MTEEVKDKQLQIIETDGKTKIIFKKAILKGKVTKDDVLNTLLIAARMQAEKYIEKLSRGAPLEPAEIKSMKELAEITKMADVMPSTQISIHTSHPDMKQIDSVKASIYEALTEKLESK